MKKQGLNFTNYYSVGQVSNITNNNYNIILSTTPNIIQEQKTEISNYIKKDNDNLTKILNINSRKRDNETQTEEIFFKM
jgi:hypothetical protein